MDLLEDKSNLYKKWNIILISLVLIFTILQVWLPKYQAIGIIGVILTVVEFIVLLITLTFNHWEMAEKHKQFSASLLIIRDEYLSLIWDIINNRLVNTEERRDNLKARLDMNYRYAPSQVEWAYTFARAGLWIRAEEQTWDYTYSDEEIDRFLPVDLRSSNYRI